MLTIKEYFTAAGLEVVPDRIKLVKHVDHVPYYSIRDIIMCDKFDEFQSEQSKEKKVFDKEKKRGQILT